MKSILRIAAATATAAALAVAIAQPAHAATDYGFMTDVMAYVENEVLKQDIRVYCWDEVYTLGDYITCVLELFKRYGVEYTAYDVRQP